MIERADVLALARETLHAYLAGATITAGAEVFPAGRMPAADCVVLDAQVAGAGGIEAARSLRMAGYEGGIVLLVSDRATEVSVERSDGEDRTEERAAARTSGPVSVRLAAMGVSRTVTYEGMAGELALAVTSAGVTTDDPALEAARRELRAAQRLNAIGDLAASVQHAANNPLTALLAEAQLLEMEPLAQEHHEAVQRIIDLSRRLAAIIRRLDLPRAR
ncbi:MAG TPA: histidine kinase dimerization/phospho-acceptor domain-containing protein [Gemmatimonadaceae bacterium]|nr:histidine kinase dimerization/phospho-acceptor domain-containing protein [Gemmatimonadaceae bacterium]